MSKAAFTALLIFSITSLGVPLGAIKPNQELTSNGVTPLSSMVGISGAVGERVFVVTASARSFPPSTCGHAEGMLSNMNCTCPPIRSVMAGALPLYGTCCVFRPVSDLNISPAMWIDVPLPDDA